MFWRVYHRQNCGLHLFAGRAGEFGWALFSVSLLVGLGGVGFCLPSRLRLRRSGLALGCVCSLALVLGLGGSSLTLCVFIGKPPDLVKYLPCSEFLVQLAWIGFSDR